MSSRQSSRRYGVVVPVKPPAFAKSRLGDLGDARRRRLAEAFAADTVRAALATDRVVGVLVATDDHRLAAQLTRQGAQVLPDATTEDLNVSLVQAAIELVRRDGGTLWPVALCADLPALRPDELGRALDAAHEEEMSFVADADRVGTTLVVAPDLDRFRPAFGPSSRDVHLDLGAHEIGLDDVPSLRRDVDTPADLASALALGIGPHTAQVAADLL